MRFERLALERYGHFTDHDIDLAGDGIRLHVLVGANEAGKTTALSAAGDLLFGIAAKSPFAFRHDYKDMRIGATLRDAEGRRLNVRRRKGNQNTLLDPDSDNRPLADGALAAFLGNADRFVFDGLFGLTHASLRAGGDDMLAAKGDLGRMLFGAGSSMRNAVGVLDALEADAAALFTPRRASTKPFYVADTLRVEAEREVRRCSLSAEAWRRNETERDEVEAALAGVRSRLGKLEARRARLERVRRTLPRLSALREAEPELAALADAPAMPADAAERVDAARLTLAVAGTRLEREEAAAADARAALAELDVPRALIAAGEEIRHLYERRGAILDGRVALAALGNQRDALRARLGGLRSDLGLAPDAPGDGKPTTPAEPALAAVRELIGRDAALGKQIDDIRERRDAAAATLAAIGADPAAAAPPPDLTHLGLAVERALSLGDIDAGLDAARRAAADADAQLASELAALPLWSGTADGLQALAVPSPETVLRFERDLGEARTLASRARDRLDAARDEEKACAQALADLSRTGPLPTGEAVGAARRHRDHGWSLIRGVFIDGEPIAEADIAAFAPRPRLAERFEQAVTTADDLADRREAEAARLARYAQLSADGAAAADQCARLGEELTRAEAAGEALLGEWRAPWQAIGLTPLPPREMTTWLARRDGVLKTFAAAKAAARSVRENEDRLARAGADLGAALRAAGNRPKIGGPFSALVKRAQALVENARTAAHNRKIVDEKRESQRAIVENEQHRLDALGGQRDAWSEAWRAALASIGLPATAMPATAAAALEIWEAIRRDGGELARIERRIGEIEAEAEAFANAVGALSARVLPDIAGGDPLAVAEQAFERLQTAKGDAKKKLDLDERLREAEAVGEKARADAGEARGELDALRTMAGCDSDDALAAAIDRARRKQELAERVAELKSAIVSDADGLGLQDAMAEAAQVGPDVLQSEIAGAAVELDELFAEHGELKERAHSLREEGAGMEASRAAAAAEQARRNALADLEECGERWMVARAAAFLLRRGIERFRQEQQGPLLARAEALFSALTLGAFVRFTIDYDNDDRPYLLGVRADGTRCPVGGMSDGTRDQLFLALRLAAIERYLETAEPLPFVADDLFVHFDDARATAGLEALIALGEKTQVLLFTHHRHLAELARQAGGPRRVRVQVIEAGQPRLL